MRTEYKTIKVKALNGFGINVEVSTNKKSYVVELDGQRFRGYRGKQAWCTAGAAENAFMNYIAKQIESSVPYKYNDTISSKGLYQLTLDTVNDLVSEGRLVIVELKTPKY